MAPRHACGPAGGRSSADVFVGGLAGQHLARIRFDENGRMFEEDKLLEGIGRVRDVRTGPDGYIYLLIDAAEAPLVRIEPAG